VYLKIMISSSRLQSRYWRKRERENVALYCQVFVAAWFW